MTIGKNADFLSAVQNFAHIKDIQTVNFTRREAIVLVAIYSYEGHEASLSQIKSRIEDSDLSECIYSVSNGMEELVINDLLEHLRSVKTIDIIDDKYTIIEDVVI